MAQYGQCPPPVVGKFYSTPDAGTYVYLNDGALHGLPSWDLLYALGGDENSSIAIDKPCMAIMTVGAALPADFPHAHAIYLQGTGQQVSNPTAPGGPTSLPVPAPPGTIAPTGGPAPTNSGVLGGLSGVVGQLQAHEKLLLALGGAYLVWNSGLLGRHRRLRLL